MIEGIHAEGGRPHDNISWMQTGSDWEILAPKMRPSAKRDGHIGDQRQLRHFHDGNGPYVDRQRVTFAN